MLTTPKFSCPSNPLYLSLPASPSLPSLSLPRSPSHSLSLYRPSATASRLSPKTPAPTHEKLLNPPPARAPSRSQPRPAFPPCPYLAHSLSLYNLSVSASHLSPSTELALTHDEKLPDSPPALLALSHSTSRPPLSLPPTIPVSPVSTLPVSLAPLSLPRPPNSPPASSAPISLSSPPNSPLASLVCLSLLASRLSLRLSLSLPISRLYLLTLTCPPFLSLPPDSPCILSASPSPPLDSNSTS